MPPKQVKCQAYWAAFVDSLRGSDPRRTARPDAFGFGGQGEIADKLAALVLAGRKRATASLPAEYTALGEALPKAGDLSIILDGAGDPVAIIERTAVELVPFGAVSAEFAAREGEGDGSLRYWRAAHAWYFGQVCERLGGTLDDTTPVLCQSFKLVWPPAASDAPET
ncbi:MAG: ASCH domain-containing protein [Ottowia sp.]|uniref:ASCH domain-containing protein n=1 Tax=Ottowia sp. TaxID=1898956 RepID=UPI0039E23604